MGSSKDRDLAPRPDSASIRVRDSVATQARLLDAAETLFAERGFEGTSMRAVTSAAGVSVSAANYHFGSKEALLRATLWRVIEPVNRARLERLSELEAAAEDGALSLEEILDAFLRPALFGSAASEGGRAKFRHVAARLFSDPPELVSAMKREYFGEPMMRFVAALARALPGREVAELAMAFEFTVAVMVHVIAGQLESQSWQIPWEQQPVSGFGSGSVPSASVPDEEVLDRMVRYAAAGLSAVPDCSNAPREPR
jgi:AcrR family transcriptional regulator